MLETMTVLALLSVYDVGGTVNVDGMVRIEDDSLKGRRDGWMNDWLAGWLD